MAEIEKKLVWNPEEGSIHLIKGSDKHRVFLMRKGFMDSFFDEILKIEGKDAVSMTIRKILEKMGASSADIGKPTVETFNKLRDDFVLPLAVKESNIPEFFKYNNGTREFVAFNSAPYMAEINGIMNMFKDVSAEILTPRGAKAIVKAVGKQAGATVGDAARVNYNWNELDSSIASLTQSTLVMFGLTGWGIPVTTSKKGADGNYMTLYRCKNTFETDGVSAKEPVCVILSSFLEGITDSITQAIAGLSAECREVKCAAMGGEYCAIALKLKPKGAPPLDWAALEGEWRALYEASGA